MGASSIKEDGAFFELDGKVWFVDRQNGKETRSEISGETVLKLLLNALDEGLDAIEKKHTPKKSPKKKAKRNAPRMQK